MTGSGLNPSLAKPHRTKHNCEGVNVGSSCMHLAGRLMSNPGTAAAAAAAAVELPPSPPPSLLPAAAAVPGAAAGDEDGMPADVPVLPLLLEALVVLLMRASAHMHAVMLSAVVCRKRCNSRS